ncbi:MAG TPA: hypothetical protein VMH02_08415 [Verrucomicrobiae bacterium]|nr:hypothetical protein [Verrucomicrobiae bacterium]
MNLCRLLLAGAFVVCALLPFEASAQQATLAPPVEQQPYNLAPPGSGRARRPRTTPSADVLERRYDRLLSVANLTAQQQSQVHALIQSYSQAHPEGSPVDPSASHALRTQIYGLLSTQQNAAVQQEIQRDRAAYREHHEGETAAPQAPGPSPSP